MGSFTYRQEDDIDRDDYVNGDEVGIYLHGSTNPAKIAFGVTCETHGEVSHGDWFDQFINARAVARTHLDTQHVLTAVEGYNIVRFLARTFLAPDASDPDEVAEAEAKADAAFAALDRFDFPLVAEFVNASGQHFEEWADSWKERADG